MKSTVKTMYHIKTTLNSTEQKIIKNAFVAWNTTQSPQSQSFADMVEKHIKQVHRVEVIYGANVPYPQLSFGIYPDAVKTAGLKNEEEAQRFIEDAIRNCLKELNTFSSK